MKLRGIEFRNAFAASGTLNFFGNGWWYHFWYKLLFPGFKKLLTCTFVAKTTTFDPRPGNMPLKPNLQPKKLLPDCIKVYPFKGIALNAVGLSGPGAIALFATNIWQNRTEPFFISFMAVGKTKKDRLEETKKFVVLFQKELPKFQAPVGIQVNMSCPNTGHRTDDLAPETFETLQLFAALGIPVDLKVNTLFDIALLKEIEESGLCDIITVSNTVPYGTYNNDINWRRLLGRSTSPLEKYGGGGLSGKVIFPIVIQRIRRMRREGIKMPIKGSGGIMSRREVELMWAAGVNAIEFATVSMIRPWQIKKIVDRADKLFSENHYQN
ncbi:MAG: hypothetical protein WC523_05900 [Patescibacteria group bacterium]|jgi:dihydroorotate dehydrogenase